jgi:D-amino peptidase
MEMEHMLTNRAQVAGTGAGRARPAFAALALFGVLGSAIPVAAYPAASNATKPPLKIYISVDMEGVAGAVTADQLSPGGFEYERFRRFMTDEALAAVKGAKAAGATEVVVSDSHGNGENLLIELFPKDVRVVRSWPRHGEMMAGLDPSFAAAVFIGYHASTTNPRGVRAHTISSAHFTRVALNGNAVTESELNAAYAGALGVPVVFISGDDAAVNEVTMRLGSMDNVITKKTLGFHSADSVTPAAACDQIYQGVLAAVSHRQQRKPYVLQAPITLEVSFKSYTSAEIVSYLRSVERSDAHSIRYVGKDMEEIMDFIVFLNYYNPEMTP